VLLTGHALDALADILEYSTSQWGRRAADRYLDELEAGIERIRQRPDLIEFLPDLHPSLGFYRVNKHLLICDVQTRSIVVLTVIHGSMDVPSRLAELQPTLTAEVEMLRSTLERAE
jgi:toxin ParE1/3/4